MENETGVQTASATGLKTAMVAPLVEKFAVPLMWLAAGYFLRMATAPRRKAAE